MSLAKILADPIRGSFVRPVVALLPNCNHCPQPLLILYWLERSERSKLRDFGQIFCYLSRVGEKWPQKWPTNCTQIFILRSNHVPQRRCGRLYIYRERGTAYYKAKLIVSSVYNMCFRGFVLYFL
jgi:hypothetical protein